MEVPSHPLNEIVDANPDVSCAETGIHIIIKGDLHNVEIFPEIMDLSGSAVVEHLEGYVQKERPHYHVWIPHKNPTLTDEKHWKAKLRAYYDTKIDGLNWNKNANAYYCVKKHNSYQAWERYVARDPEVKISSWIKWNRYGDPPPLVITQRTMVTVGQSTTKQTGSQLGRKQTTLDKQQRFLRFVQDCFDPDEYNTLTPEILTDYLFEYCGKNEFVSLQASYTFINYALSQLLTGEARNRYKSRFRDVIISKFF